MTPRSSAVILYLMGATTNKATATEQLRQDNGQFGHGLDAMCVCGRTKGVHDAVRPFPFGEADGGPDCDRFRRVRAPKKLERWLRGRGPAGPDYWMSVHVRALLT